MKSTLSLCLAVFGLLSLTAGEAGAQAPVITKQPVGQTVAVGSTVSLTVTANAKRLAYQWRINGTNLANGGDVSGATTATLTFTRVQLTNAATYSVAVSNGASFVVSSNAVLTVDLPPAITGQPTNQTILAGGTASFSVTATGSAPLSYQWKRSGTNLPAGGNFGSVTNSILTITNVQAANAGTYTVVVTNLVGTVTSTNAVLTVNVPPALTTQPTNQTVVTGTTVTFTAVATGSATLRYQWKLNNTNLVRGGNVGAVTNATLTITGVQLTNAGTYTLLVTNLYGTVLSSNAVLSVFLPAPVITSQPTNETVVTGGTVTFGVVATGNAPLRYQWKRNGTNLVKGGNIGSVTNTTLTIANAQSTNAGIYTVAITNASGFMVSSNAVLTVVNPTPPVLVPGAGVPGGPFQITIAGGGAANLIIQVKTNLTDVAWVSLSTNPVVGGQVIFTDAGASNYPSRYYRALSSP